MKKIKFSIIIPVPEINDYIKTFTPRILKQTYKNFEIIIIPNELPKEKFILEKTRIIKSGNAGPAQKRDIGARIARGEVLAFIDDDAYPGTDWLERAEEYFRNTEIAGVGGPQLTPIESNKFQKLSGAVLSSWMVSGDQAHRYAPYSKTKECYDLPSCNLFIRRDVFLKIGGFDTSFWPGEDTKLCRDIKNLGKKIIYDPKIIVYHHRRKNLKGYTKQIIGYAKHRGFFMKKYPETSLRPAYLVPALFIIGLAAGLILSVISYPLRLIYISILIIYLMLLTMESARITRLRNYPQFLALSFYTHIIYGIGIIKGLAKKDLKSKYIKK